MFPLSDVWAIPYLNPKAKERTGYPTQKPILLLERIIHLSTDAGDVVLDPFCGSGTTLVAAQLLGRSGIGIDVSEEAVELTRCRLAEPVKDGIQSSEERTGFLQNRERGCLVSPQWHLAHSGFNGNNGIDAFLTEVCEGVPIPVRVQRHGEDCGRGYSSFA